jgi:hypothetical protein
MGMARARWLILALGLCYWAPDARACSPCVDPLDLRTTALCADVVVVAQKIGEDFQPVAGSLFGRDIYASFQVREALKGSPPTRIDVGRDQGMCAADIALERGDTALLFLNFDKATGRYITVRGGCAVRSLPVVGGEVVLSGLTLPTAILAERLGLRPPAPAGRTSIDWPRTIAYVLLFGAMAAVGFELGRRRRR